jgi:dCTP deaminase
MINGRDLLTLLNKPADSKDPLLVIPSPDFSDASSLDAASIDLRLGTWFGTLKQNRASLLDVRKAMPEPVCEASLTKMHYVRFGNKFILHPGSFVLGVTLEWIRVPRSIGGYVTSKSSWGRRGLVIATAVGVHPGFCGCLTLELCNLGEVPISLYPGMTVSQIFFHRAEAVNAKVGRSPRANQTQKSRFGGKRKPTLGAIDFDRVAESLAYDEFKNTEQDVTVPGD